MWEEQIAPGPHRFREGRGEPETTELSLLLSEDITNNFIVERDGFRDDSHAASYCTTGRDMTRTPRRDAEGTSEPCA